MRRFVLPAAVLAVLLAAPAAAQSSAPLTRDDSLNVGRKYVQWVYEAQLDSLWDRFDEQMRGALGSKDGLQQQIDQIGINFGGEMEVLEETVTARDGNLVYTREVKFDARPDEPAVWMFAIAPDGMIKGAGMRPKSAVQQQQQQRAEPAKRDSAPKPAQ